MSTVVFSEVLDAADKLSPEEQDALIDVLHRRQIERRREEIRQAAEEAEREFQAGLCRPVTPDELMRELLS